MTSLPAQEKALCAGMYKSFLAALLLAGASPAWAAQSGDLFYTVVSGAEVTITGYAGDGGTLTIPSMIAGLPVTRIGEGAFDWRTELTGTLVIPDSVVSIESGAFSSCTNLTGVVLGSGLQEIGVWAFGQCFNLGGGLVIPDGVSLISDSAFTRCESLMSLTLGTGVKEIGAAAFGSCHSLSNDLVLPAGVTNIGASAFGDCFHLTGNLVIPDSVTKIGYMAFRGCENLTGLTIGAGVTEIGYGAFYQCFSLAGGVIIPDAVSQIELSTFSQCTSLNAVVVGSGVTNIGTTAFVLSSNLSAIYFKGASPTLGTAPFGGTSATIYYTAGQPGWGATFGGRPTAPWAVTAVFDAGLGSASYGSKSYNVGNPFGDLPTASRAMFGFAGWRTAEDDFDSIITVDSLVPYATSGFRLYATWAMFLQTVTFDAQGGDPVSPASKAVAFNTAYGELPTPTRAGYTFCGWRLNADGSGEEIKDTTVDTALSNHTLFAKWNVNAYTATFDAQGGSAINPSDKGVVFDAAYGAMPASCRLGYAFGGWWTGANGTGSQMTESTPVATPASHTLYARWTYDPSAAQSAVAGVALALPLPGTFSGAARVTVKGLPTGLKYDSANKIVTGVPTKAAAFAVTVSAEGVTPLAFTFTIFPLPVWAYGSFSGYHGVNGTSAMTVSAQGKVAGKLSFNGTNYLFIAASFAAGGNEATGFLISTDARAGKAVLPVELQVQPKATSDHPTLGVASGTFEWGPYYWVSMYRDLWKEEPAALSPFIGYYTATLSGSDTYGSGYLTLTVDKAGKVKAAGKLADGTALSLAGTLALTDEGNVIVPLYASPTAYKGGRFFTVVQLVKPTPGNVYLRALASAEVDWRSHNPQATETYGASFYRKPGLAGGWYDKLGNLRNYYGNADLLTGTNAGAPVLELTVGTASYPASVWDVAGVTISVTTNRAGILTGLSAPAAGVPTDANDDGVWDYSAENVIGLKIGLARATGIFKGSFKAWFDYGTTHTSKTLAFEGALTPERQNKADGEEGRGFFLWAEKITPPSPAKPYTFKWSYDFLLKAE